MAYPGESETVKVYGLAVLIIIAVAVLLIGFGFWMGWAGSH